MRRTVLAAVALAVAALAIGAAAVVVRARADAGGTPSWDAASHGLQGVAVAQDIARADLPNFVADVVGHRYRYPPVHPLLLAAAYLLFGPTWLTAAGVSAALFAALVLLLFGAGRFLASGAGASNGAGSGAGAAVGLGAALLALTSPALLAFAGNIMLELPAAALGVLVAWLYAASLDGASGRTVRLLGWTLTAFMLTASQYGACWVAALALYELRRDPAGYRRSAADAARRFFRSRALLHPLHVLAALAFLLAAAVAVTGGWKIPAGSRTLSMTRPGGPFIAGMLLLGARVGWLAWRRRDALRAAVPARYRILFATAAAPIFLWYFVLYPPRFAHYADWVARSPGTIPRSSPEHWTYYPTAFVEQGHVAPVVAAAVLALAAASFLRRRVPERVRVLRWGVLCTAVLVTAHHARQERFLLPFLPAWWLLAAETAAAGWEKASLGAARLRLGGAPFALLAAATAAGAGIAATPAVRDLYGARLKRDLAASHGPPAYAAVLARVADEAAPARSVLVIGTFSGLSHHLFEWELRRRVDLRGRTLDHELDHPLKTHGRDPEGPRKVFEAWLAKSPEERVFALEPIDLEARPARPVADLGEHDMEWDYATMRLLRGSDRVSCRAEWVFGDAGLRVRLYGTGAAGSPNSEGSDR